MCVENKCAAYNFGTGLMGGDSDACTAGIQLTTNTDSSCGVKCDTGSGYAPQTGTVSCSSSANEGERNQLFVCVYVC